MSGLPILFGYHASGLGNSHVPLSLCRHWDAAGLEVRLYVPSREDSIQAPWVLPALGGLKKKLIYRFAGADSPKNAAIRLFFSRESKAPIVFLWAGLPLEVFERCKQQGSAIIIERINCHQATSRKILLQSYRQLGLTGSCPITEADIAVENQKLTLADAVFCPSPMVYQSMLENNVAAEKLLSTSYGWAPSRFPDREIRPDVQDKPVFLFVGTLCVRKGIPLLLKAWQQAGINGTLILCGGMDGEIKTHFGDMLQADTIRYMPYTKDIGKLYNQAHVFVFPTLEEGGPMVTYEAMAHGIPPLVTAMGAGAIGRDGQDCMVLPDDDPKPWIAALRTMAENPEKRLTLGKNARQRARKFTWKKVAAQRAELLQKKFPDLWCTHD
jgi:glycosyltransferase involved in cell wall biosynthesis